MAYNKKVIYEQAKKVIVKNKLFFIEDIIAFLPITKPTFYDYYKVDSDEFNELKALLDINKTELKVSMRSKWYDSDSPVLQIALMKLVCNDEERRKISSQFIEAKTENKIELGAVIDWTIDEPTKI